MRGLALWGACLSLGASTAAAAVDVSVDPRLELLGVVQALSGERPDAPFAQDYARRVEERFGALRGHPAVKIYREVMRKTKGEESYGILILYYTGPPALKLKDKAGDTPYVYEEAARDQAQRFLWELRDFAAVSGFDGFFEENRPFYRRVEAQAREELGRFDPVGLIEEYAGMGLVSRGHYLLSPLYVHSHQSSYIVPYPDPLGLTSAVPEGFEVYTLLPYVAREDRPAKAEAAFGMLSDSLWQEPLYVLVDPSFHYFEQWNLGDPVSFYGPAVAQCRVHDANCAKGYVVAALVDRLHRKAFGKPPRPDPSDPADTPERRRYVAALSKRLEEYEGRSPRSSSLWEFYPRLFSVFHELAFPGAAGPALSLPPAKIENVSDFFDPGKRPALLRSGARTRGT